MENNKFIQSFFWKFYISIWMLSIKFEKCIRYLIVQVTFQECIKWEKKKKNLKEWSVLLRSMISAHQWTLFLTVRSSFERLKSSAHRIYKGNLDPQTLPPSFLPHCGSEYHLQAIPSHLSPPFLTCLYYC
jgi:hypothetical protein